jgi:hypothetical protein
MGRAYPGGVVRRTYGRRLPGADGAAKPGSHHMREPASRSDPSARGIYRAALSPVPIFQDARVDEWSRRSVSTDRRSPVALSLAHSLQAGYSAAPARQLAGVIRLPCSAIQPAHHATARTTVGAARPQEPEGGELGRSLGAHRYTLPLGVVAIRRASFRWRLRHCETCGAAVVSGGAGSGCGSGPGTGFGTGSGVGSGTGSGIGSTMVIGVLLHVAVADGRLPAADSLRTGPANCPRDRLLNGPGHGTGWNHFRRCRPTVARLG